MRKTICPCLDCGRKDENDEWVCPCSDPACPSWSPPGPFQKYIQYSIEDIKDVHLKRDYMEMAMISSVARWFGLEWKEARKHVDQFFAELEPRKIQEALHAVYVQVAKNWEPVNGEVVKKLIEAAVECGATDEQINNTILKAQDDKTD